MFPMVATLYLDPNELAKAHEGGNKLRVSHVILDFLPCVISTF